MKKAIKIISLLILISISASAQKEASLWYFGKNSGLDFRNLKSVSGLTIGGVANQTLTGVPTAVEGPISTWEGCFTLCDKDGKFLFASDGMTVYNGPKSTDIMENGTGLWGNPSSAQSGVIVPRPGYPNNYFIVSSDATDIGTVGRGITFSEVDLSANAGKGKVLYKNSKLNLANGLNRNEAYEGVAAFAHTNGQDYWLLHRARGFFFLWLVTKDGINPTPVKSFAIGADPGTSGIVTGKGSSGLGHTKFSADGKYIANTAWQTSTGPTPRSHITMAKFDAATGNISEILTKTIDRVNAAGSGIGVFYGIEYSPNAKFLYFTMFNKVNVYGDLWRVNVDDAFKNKNIAWSVLIEKEVTRVTNIGVGPDNRMYGITGDNASATPNAYNFLIVFLNPDEGGDKYAIIKNHFITNKTPSWGLPNFVYSFFGTKPITGDKIACIHLPAKYNVQVEVGNGVNAISRLEWDFGDGSAKVHDDDMNQFDFTQTHIYTIPGKYTLSVTPYRKLANGTYQAITDKKQSLLVDATPCTLVINPQNRSYYNPIEQN